MEFQEALIIKKQIEDQVDIASNILRGFGRGSNGLIKESEKNKLEFITAKKNYDIAFAKLREINSFFLKKFKKEYLLYRKNK